MEKIKVTFENVETNQKFIVDFKHDPETKTLDFKVTPEPEFDPKQDYGLNMYMANMFLSMLTETAENQETDKIEEEKEKE